MTTHSTQSKIYSTPISLLPYLISAFSICLDYIFNNFGFLCLSISVFMIWDYGFYIDEDTTVGRTADSVNNSTHTARQQTSYFLPFYIIIFGYFFTLDTEKRQLIINTFNDAGVPPILIALPFLISCVGLLFMPVQISKEEGGSSVSRAQKSILAFTALTQQSVILILAHTILRLFKQLGKL